MATKKKIAVYPGSFDPITLGHVDIIERMSKNFDEMIILVAESPEKNSLFTYDERKAFIEESLKHLGNIKVDLSSGLTVDYCKQIGAQIIVRGLRAVVDFEYEMTMANMNRKLAPNIETLLVFASPDYYFISSRGVKEVAKHGGDLSGLTPKNVIPALKKRAKKGK